jgi:signal transduction histidine kinase
MQSLTAASYALVGVAIMIAVLMVVVVIMIAKALSGRRSRKPESRGESAMLSMALQEAVAKLKAQERATAARAEASERLSSQIVEGLTSGLVVVDRAGRVQSINPAASRILSLDDAAMQVPFRELLAKAPALADVIGEALVGSAPIVRRTVALGGGTARPSHLGVTVSPIVDAGGELQAAVCLFTDLTAVVELEAQLRLKEALARLGELTAGLAHEFRNGLATIHGYGRLLDPASLPEPQRAYVEGIRAETTALGEVVTNFLRFAKPEQLAMAPVDLRAVIVRAVEDLPGGAEAVAVEGEFAVIDGDDALLRHAFNNLLRNSLEACAAGGMAPRISVRGQVGAQDVRITVDDNGPGLAQEALNRLFQPFATTKPTGTGLGLAIVQKVIVSHNGVIAAGNRPEGGAQFRLRLPLKSSP